MKKLFCVCDFKRKPFVNVLGFSIFGHFFSVKAKEAICVTDDYLTQSNNYNGNLYNAR